jgi:hypothetical protein
MLTGFSALRSKIAPTNSMKPEKGKFCLGATRRPNRQNTTQQSYGLPACVPLRYAPLHLPSALLLFCGGFSEKLNFIHFFFVCLNKCAEKR